MHAAEHHFRLVAPAAASDPLILMYPIQRIWGSLPKDMGARSEGRVGQL